MNCLILAVEGKSCLVGLEVIKNWMYILAFSIIDCETVPFEVPFLFLYLQLVNNPYHALSGLPLSNSQQAFVIGYVLIIAPNLRALLVRLLIGEDRVQGAEVNYNSTLQGSFQLVRLKILAVHSSNIYKLVVVIFSWL